MTYIPQAPFGAGGTVTATVDHTNLASVTLYNTLTRSHTVETRKTFWLQNQGVEIGWFVSCAQLSLCSRALRKSPASPQMRP
jgi:hypothetical protein